MKDFKVLNQILEDKLSKAQSIHGQYDEQAIEFEFARFERDLRGNPNNVNT